MFWQLAEALGVSRYTVRSWEEEKSSPSHELLTAICRYYGVSANYLLGLSDVDPAYAQRRRLETFSAGELREYENYLIWRRKRRRAEDEALEAVRRAKEKYRKEEPVHAK